MLAYPSGASSVRCAVCMTVNQLVTQQQMANVRCEGCNTHLMYSSGANSVRCALCNHVTRVGGHVNPSHQHQPQPTSGGSQAGDSSSGGGNLGDYGRQNSHSLYVIQNPSEEGEEAFNMAIGIKQISNP